MEAKEPAKLRRFEFFYTNGLTVLLLALFFSLAIFLHSGYMYLVLGVVFIVQGILSYIYKEPQGIFYLPPAMRLLRQYEKAKFGEEWASNYRMHAGLYLAMAAFWFWSSKIAWGQLLDLNMARLVVPLLFVVAALNLYRFLRNRKVDRKAAGENAVEDLKMFEIVGGLVCGVVIFVFVVAYFNFTG